MSEEPSNETNFVDIILYCLLALAVAATLLWLALPFLIRC